MKHCKDNDSNITSVLNVAGIRKRKDQRNLFKFSCLLVYFCRIWIDLYLMISKRQRWDLVLKTLIWQHLRNLQFSLKDRKIKSIFHAQCLTSDALSQPLVRHLIVDCFVQDYLTSVFGKSHGWTKHQGKNRNFQYWSLFPAAHYVHLDHVFWII